MNPFLVATDHPREALPRVSRRSVWLGPLLCYVASALLLLILIGPSHAAGIGSQEILLRESGYVVDCSFTEFARNHSGARPGADAYGALNVDRIYQRGPDWVRPGEAAMGAIGLMAAARQLHQAGIDVSVADQVLDRFFNTWLLTRQQPVVTSPGSPDAGGIAERIYYNVAGQRLRSDPANAAVTGQMVVAMWKYYEYKAAIGQQDAANRWLQQAGPLATAAGAFLLRCYAPGYGLVRSNSESTDLWVSDSTFAAAAFRCLDQWRADTRAAAATAETAAEAQIAAGLQAMEDHSDRASFCRYRDSGRSYTPTYGDQIDQLCFLPYEADVLDPGDGFARQVSDWWTNGSGGIVMTPQSTNPADWRYFGTHLRHLFAGGADNDQLYAGAALQLAKVEWKAGQKTGDSVLISRARQRLDWVLSSSYSDLWLGAGGVTEAGVPNGLVDWRDDTDFNRHAQTWERFLDSSAYLIEASLMLDEGVDTRYVPE